MSRMPEFPAVLTRELHARVIDVSESGCLVETRRRLEVGTIGRLGSGSAAKTARTTSR